jgi:phage shock protein C
MDRRLVAGVAAGAADYLDVDVVIVRIALVVLALMGGIGLPLYLAAWVLVPEDGADESLADELLGRARSEVTYWREGTSAGPGEGTGHGV